MFSHTLTKFFYLFMASLVISAVLVTSQPPYQAQAAFGDRIAISNGQFFAGSTRIWINGANTPWNNWNDFGGSYNASWWSDHFQALHDNGVNATRVWITCSGEVGILIDENGYVSGATDKHWQDLDSFFQIAQQKQIYIMATLISFDHFSSNYTTYQRWRNWINSDSNIDSYINNYLIPFVNRYKNNPYLWSIDLANEPDWIYENSNISWDRLQSYFARASRAIHENSPILVTVGLAMPKYNSNSCSGCEGNKIADSALKAKVNDSDVYIDFYSSHYYGWQDPYWGIPYYKTPLQYYGESAGKPVLVGEGPANGSTNHSLTEDYENAYNNGWQGVMPWTSNGVDSNGGFDQLTPATRAFRDNHYNLVFPSGGSSPTNTPAPTATGAAQNPYGGSAWAIPGTIQAEDYDTGGQNVAYYDTSSGNSGGQYRSDDVDIEDTTDSGGGKNVGWIDNGEWLEYTVNVTSGGAYKVEVRVASAQSGGKFRIEMDGATVVSSQSFSGTGGWQNWITVTINNVNLTAGQKVMRLVMEQDGFNVNWVKFTSASSSPTNTPVPATPTPTRTNTPSAPTNTPAGGLTIYGDSTSWENWSWNTTVNLNNSSPVQAGSKSIAVTYTSGWAGLSLRKAGGQSTAGYNKITFYVHGGSSGTRTFNFYINTSDSGGQSASVSVSAPAGQWTLVTINLSQVGNPSTIARINFQENTGGTQPVFYIDEIKLMP